MKTQFIVVLVSFIVLASISADVLPATEGGEEGVATTENMPAKTAQEEKNAKTEKTSFNPESIRLPKDFMDPNTYIRRITSDPDTLKLFHGGWGYDIEHPCVIFEKRGQGNTAEGIRAEKFFARIRMTHERINSKIKYSIVNTKFISQALIHHNGKPYDKLVFEVTIALRNDDNQATQEKPAERRKYTFQTTYWFDISNFFGVEFD